MERPTLRALVEIQHAHDVLHAVVECQPELQFPQEQADLFHAVHDALSWVLSGPCGDAFSKGLAQLEQLMRERGYREVRVQ